MKKMYVCGVCIKLRNCIKGPSFRNVQESPPKEFTQSESIFPEH